MSPTKKTSVKETSRKDSRKKSMGGSKKKSAPSATVVHATEVSKKRKTTKSGTLSGHHKSHHKRRRRLRSSSSLEDENVEEEETSEESDTPELEEEKAAKTKTATRQTRSAALKASTKADDGDAVIHRETVTKLRDEFREKRDGQRITAELLRKRPVEDLDRQLDVNQENQTDKDKKEEPAILVMSEGQPPAVPAKRRQTVTSIDPWNCNPAMVTNVGMRVNKESVVCTENRYAVVYCVNYLYANIILPH